MKKRETDIYAALQKEHTERETELANKYRDRAAERRDGKMGAEDKDLGAKFSGKNGMKNPARQPCFHVH